MAKISKTNLFNSSCKIISTIKFNLYKGINNGNIFPPTPYPSETCEIKLDFSCEDNSQYIPVI